tara:strand:+ start:206 stop:451 length:246 start_codon:yes stop_codon:yes gene_type:complete
MFGLDTIKRLIWGDLEKDIVRRWASEKIRNEKEHQEFIEKCKTTPSFSRCVIPNKSYQSIEKSQKQKQQLKSYRDAVVNEI